MKVTDEVLDAIYLHTQNGAKYLPEFEVDIIDEAGELVARTVKTLYVRKKQNLKAEE